VRLWRRLRAAVAADPAHGLRQPAGSATALQAGEAGKLRAARRAAATCESFPQIAGRFATVQGYRGMGSGAFFRGQ